MHVLKMNELFLIVPTTSYSSNSICMTLDRGNLMLTDDEKTATVVLTKSDIYTPQKEWPGLIGSFRIYIGGTEVQVLTEEDIVLESGGVYTLVIHENKTHIAGNLVTISPPNRVHMLWLLPQYAVMTIAEIMFVVTGIEFSYSQFHGFEDEFKIDSPLRHNQFSDDTSSDTDDGGTPKTGYVSEAPGSMKSVLSASWLLTVAFGNLLVVIISHARIFKNLADEFFLFVILMLVDMAVFIAMAARYHYASVYSDTEINLQKLG